jgi:hypothetical protein
MIGVTVAIGAGNFVGFGRVISIGGGLIVTSGIGI